jgi:hypothetical protein
MEVPPKYRLPHPLFIFELETTRHVMLACNDINDLLAHQTHRLDANVLIENN